MRCPEVLLPLGCAAALLLQLGLVLRSYVSPTLTLPTVEHRALKDIGFPLIFKICVDPSFNKTAVNESGYGGVVWEYVIGQSLFNGSILGWAGHTASGGVQGTVEELLARVRGHMPQDVVRGVTMTHVDNDVTWITWDIGQCTRVASTGVNCSQGLDQHLYLKAVNFPHNCYTLDLTTHVDVQEKGLMELGIMFKDIENSTVTIKIEGITMSENTIIKSNAFYSESITLKDKTTQEYAIQIEKNVFMENHPTKICRNYPNSEFISYSQCVDQELQRTVSGLFPGLVPIWLAEDLKDVTTHAAFAKEGDPRRNKQPLGRRDTRLEVAVCGSDQFGS
jgi:hypothetical protein